MAPSAPTISPRLCASSPSSRDLPTLLPPSSSASWPLSLKWPRSAALTSSRSCTTLLHINFRRLAEALARCSRASPSTAAASLGLSAVPAPSRRRSRASARAAAIKAPLPCINRGYSRSSAVLKWPSVAPGPVRPRGKVVERGVLCCSEVGAEYSWLGGAAPVAEMPCMEAATRALAEGSTRQARRIAFMGSSCASDSKPNSAVCPPGGPCCFVAHAGALAHPGA